MIDISLEILNDNLAFMYFEYKTNLMYFSVCRGVNRRFKANGNDGKETQDNLGHRQSTSPELYNPLV